MAEGCLNYTTRCWTASSIAVGPNCAKSIAREILVLIDRAVNEDGSIKFHTERGDRALYYHSSGLGYATVGLEIAKFFELEIPKDLDTRIERAGEVFYSGFNDHAYMDKWAKNANRGRATKVESSFLMMT